MFLFQVVLFLICLFSSFIINDVYLNGIVVFWLYLIVFILELLYQRRITLLSTFLIAYIYMIPGEAILQRNELYSMWGKEYVNTAMSYLIMSSFALFLGFKFADFILSKSWNFRIKYERIMIEKRGILLFFIFFYNFFLFLVNFDNTVYGFTMGRASAFPYTFSSLLYALAFITVGLTQKLTANKFKTILYSLPIIITFIGTGTRFFLVFLIFIIFFQDLYRFSIRKSYRLIIGAIFIVIAINTIRDVRREGITGIFETTTKKFVYSGLTEKLVSYGSSEGLVRNIAMITRYTKEHDYTYGKSIGFFGIFWIPRQIYPEKPVMLDSWLVKQYYTEYGDGYSTASSYGGELYMDFGFGLASLLLFIGGIYLCKLNYWIHYNYKSDFKKYILSGFLYGWVFFGTRSIVTSSFMLVYMLIVSYFVFYLLFRFKILKRELNTV